PESRDRRAPDGDAAERAGDWFARRQAEAEADCQKENRAVREPVQRLPVRQHVRPEIIAGGAHRRRDDGADNGISHPTASSAGEAALARSGWRRLTQLIVQRKRMLSPVP